VLYAIVEFPVDGDPYCSLTQYWAFIEVGQFSNQVIITCNNSDCAMELMDVFGIMSYCFFLDPEGSLRATTVVVLTWCSYPFSKNA